MRTKLEASRMRSYMLVLLALVLISGCQATPEKEVVIEPPVVVEPSEAPADPNGCFEYLSKNINPMTFDTLAAVLSKLPSKKDEFESTADFEKRLNKAKSKIPDKFIISIPINSNFIEYDADKRILEVRSPAIKTMGTNYDGVFGFGTDYYKEIKYWRYQNIDAVVETKSRNVGDYVGQNAFGTSTHVSRIDSLTKVVFERAGERNQSLFFNLRPQSSMIVEFPETPPDIAKKFKFSLKSSLVIAPKQPFLVKGSGTRDAPTIQDPVDWHKTLEVIVADIQCALFTDESGWVYGVVRTR